MFQHIVSILRIRAVLLMFVILLTSSCATINYEGDGKDLPPILAQDEIIRPYVKLGRIQVTVDTSVITIANLQEWGFRVLREEAFKMKADAVMFPEVVSRPTTYMIIPSNEYRASGMAIKFL